MTPTTLALLALSLVLAAFLPACYRATAALERLSAPTLPGEAPKLRDGSPAPVSPLLRVATKPKPVEDEAAFVRRRDDYLQQFGVHLPAPPPRGVEVDTSTLTPVREIR